MKCVCQTKGIIYHKDIKGLSEYRKEFNVSISSNGERKYEHSKYEHINDSREHEKEHPYLKKSNAHSKFTNSLTVPSPSGNLHTRIMKPININTLKLLLVLFGLVCCDSF